MFHSAIGKIHDKYNSIYVRIIIVNFHLATLDIFFEAKSHDIMQIKSCFHRKWASCEHYIDSFIIRCLIKYDFHI